MSVAHPAHPFPSTDARSSLFARRRRPSDPTASGPTGSTVSGSTASGPTVSGPNGATVVPGTRTPVGLPRDLVVDESGKPRRSVLLAAIMIRRGRSVAEIAAATGLAPDVVTCLSRSV